MGSNSKQFAGDYHFYIIMKHNQRIHQITMSFIRMYYRLEMEPLGFSIMVM